MLQSVYDSRVKHLIVYQRLSYFGFQDSQSLQVEETARTIAHELGHNFGLKHDTEECECQGCIMATEVE